MRTNRSVKLALLVFVSSAAALAGAFSGASAQGTPAQNAGPIKHIIFFIKENRTFDDYFGTYPNANGATTATSADGKAIPLAHQKDQIPDIDHSSEGAFMAYDGGKMDMFQSWLVPWYNGYVTTVGPVFSLKLVGPCVVGGLKNDAGPNTTCTLSF
jgi:phospholipase C